MPVIREIHAEGWCVRLDLGQQVLALNVPEHNPLRWHEDGLSPTVPLAFDGFVSAAPGRRHVLPHADNITARFK